MNRIGFEFILSILQILRILFRLFVPLRSISVNPPKGTP